MSVLWDVTEIHFCAKWKRAECLFFVEGMGPWRGGLGQLGWWAWSARAVTGGCIGSVCGPGPRGEVAVWSVELLIHVRLFATPWTAAHQASLSITNSRSLLKLTSIELVMSSNHFILCRPLLLPPSIFPSIRVFSSESFLCMRQPKYWSFSFSFSPSNEYSGPISFRMDWLDLLAVRGALKSLLPTPQFKSIHSSAVADGAGIPAFPLQSLHTPVPRH